MKGFQKWNDISLVLRIIGGLLIGVVLALLLPEKASGITILGDLFVGALKAVAPILVLFLVTGAIAKHKAGQKTNLGSIVGLYIIGTFLAGATAVIASFIFKFDLVLTKSPDDVAPPSGVLDVLKTIIFKVVDNPVNAILDANYIGILAWAVVLGLALKFASDSSKNFVSDMGEAFSKVVKWVISFAPFGVMGLVFASITKGGLESLGSYAKILILLVGTMFFIALVVNPIIVFIKTKENPYPLVFKCLKDSGITAFFTRSSAANIPVNMNLCEKLGLEKETYSISIPLGATINMAGAAVTIAILTLAAVHTLGIKES